MKRILFASLAALALGCGGSADDAGGSSTAGGEELPPAPTISGDEARRLVADGAFLLDVTPPPRNADSQIEGATNIPLPELRERMSEVPRDRPVVAYCRGGRGSPRAGAILLNEGYDVRVMGAMTNWPEDEPEGVAYPANPLLNMYVQGPNPMPGEYLDGTPDDYRASIVVTNTGDAPVEVSFAHIALEAWRGEEVVCDDPEAFSGELEGPAELGPGEAHTYRAQLHCEHPGDGELEIRAYMAFGTEGSLDRERHYIGSYTIAAP